MRILLAATIAAAGFSGPALANGDSGKCFDKATLSYVDCPGQDIWTGPYIGLHAGYGEADVSGDFFDDSAADALQLDFDELDLDGFVGGGQVGYNEQFNEYVIGVELDVSYVDFEDTVAGLGGQPENGSAEVNAIASLRLRLGAVIDNFLPYITGGVGLVDYEIAFNDPADNAGAIVENSVSDDTVFAGVLGGGVEVMAFQNVSLRAEGLYYFIDEETDISGLVDAAPGSGYELEDLWTVRAALNYHF